MGMFVNSGHHSLHGAQPASPPGCVGHCCQTWPLAACIMTKHYESFDTLWHAFRWALRVCMAWLPVTSVW